MENGLIRVPELAMMAAQEEMQYIRNNAFLFDTHPLVREFVDLCPGFPDGPVKILDIGCGVANMAAQFALAVPEAAIVGVDTSPTMVSHGRLLVDHFGLGQRVSVRLAHLPDGDFGEPPNSFDLVFARSVLHHFADPMGFWEVVRRYSKPDAALFVLDLLRPPSAARLNELVWQRFEDNMSPIRQAYHMSLLASHTLDEVVAQLEAAGLADAETTATLYGPPGPPTHVRISRPGRFGGKVR